MGAHLLMDAGSRSRILSVILPCYNEPDTIGPVAARVAAIALPPGWSREVIVVDDGSGAPTRQALSAVLQDHPDIILVTRPENGGKGAALKDGFRAATGDWLAIQDADLEYDPNDLSRLLELAISGDARVVFGSRTLEDNNTPGRFWYFWGGRLVNWVFNAAFGTRLSDLTTCQKLFPRELVPQLLAQPSDDFVFDSVELSYVLSREPIAEAPIRYQARRAGEGKKLTAADGVRMVLRIVELRLGRAARPLRFLVVGGLAAAINIALLYTLTEFAGVWYLVSEIIAFLAALAVNFALQRLWTFRSRSQHPARQAAAFLGINLTNLLVNAALLYVFVEWVGLWYVWGQALASAIIAVESYFLYRGIFRA